MVDLPPPRSARSYLYVPGDRPDRLDRAVARGADALIIDLEDSVALAAKPDARRHVAAWLSRLDQREARPVQVWVRVNADALADDLDAVAVAEVDGIVLPKAEPPLVEAADRLLADLERRRGLRRIGMIGLIETARGLLAAAAIAGSPRVRHLGLGEADLAGDLRVALSPTRQELTSLRLQVVLASAAAGIGAPIGPTSTDFRDLDAFAEGTRILAGLGFRARTAIHPAQVPVINDVFTPGPEEVAVAVRIVTGHEAAQAGGSGVHVDEHGHMVDAAVVRAAREILDRARAAARS